MKSKQSLSDSRISLLFPVTFPAHRYSVAQAKAARTIKRIHVDVLELHDLTMPEWLLLGLLTKGQWRIGTVAQVLDVQSTYITAVTKELQHKELITTRSDEYDGRSKWLVLTPKGKRRVKTVDAGLAEALAARLPGVPARDMRAYLRTLELLSKQ